MSARGGAKEVDYATLCEGIRRRLVNHRTALRLNVSQAAKLAGLSRTGLEKMEDGDTQPSLDSLMRLSRAYGESLPAFLWAVEESLGVAREERARLFEKETLTHEREALFLELAVKLGFSEWLEETRLLAGLAEVDRDTAEALRKVIQSAARGAAR
jgi:transcriptional regulator with XRE-family HTH domain